MGMAVMIDGPLRPALLVEAMHTGSSPARRPAQQVRARTARLIYQAVAGRRPQREQVADGGHPRTQRPDQPPEPAKGSRGGRPLSFNAETYRYRNVVERALNRLTGWWGLATRYDKHAQLQAGLVLAHRAVLRPEVTDPSDRPKLGDRIAEHQLGHRGQHPPELVVEL